MDFIWLFIIAVVAVIIVYFLANAAKGKAQPSRGKGEESSAPEDRR